VGVSVPLLHLIVLALVQGITEFLPISSSGHLVLTWQVLDAQGWATPGQSDGDRLILDVAVHLGTLLAVVCYFRRDVGEMAAGLAGLATGRRNEGTRLAGLVLIATVPILLAGVALKDRITEHLRGEAVIAWATIGFALLLYLADRTGALARRLSRMRFGDAVVVGTMQILALVPGTSRAGITMTAARFLGYDRQEAARFSLLLAIPAILGAGALTGLDLYQSGNLRLGLDALIAASLAFLAALAAIWLMMRWLARASFTPFVVYRLFLGGVLLWLIYA
jgi:undecaprenyl-diphosphatase